MKPLPVVAIMGFPNVGKSTLFNRFLGKKKALVHSLPGMTRDAVSAFCVLGGKRFILTDTGGLEPEAGASLGAAVTERAWTVARQAAVVLFVLDAKRELTAAEEELFASLRKLGRPVLVVLNKVDSGLQEDRAGEYFNRLKAAEIHTISAEHLRNLDELEASLVRLLPASDASAEPPHPLRLAIIGRTNVGKSSIVNRLAGEERLIVSPSPGTTRDSTDTFVLRDGKLFCLVDTAGMRKLNRTRDEREQAGIIKAEKDIVRADVLCVVLDAREFPTRQDATVAYLADQSGKPLLLALNKWDLIPKGESPQTLKKRHLRPAVVRQLRAAPVRLRSVGKGRRQDPGHGRGGVQERLAPRGDAPAEQVPGGSHGRPPALDPGPARDQVSLHDPEGRAAADFHRLRQQVGRAAARLREVLYPGAARSVRVPGVSPPAAGPAELVVRLVNNLHRTLERNLRDGILVVRQPAGWPAGPEVFLTWAVGIL